MESNKKEKVPKGDPKFDLNLNEIKDFPPNLRLNPNLKNKLLN